MNRQMWLDEWLIACVYVWACGSVSKSLQLDLASVNEHVSMTRLKPGHTVASFSGEYA